MPKTPAKMAPASKGPRQFNADRLRERSSDMVEQLPLTLTVRGDRRWCQPVRPVPNAIEEPKTGAQFLRNFEPHLHRCLRAPSPPARELIEIFAIRAISPNRQPRALRQSGQESQVCSAKCQPQFTFPFQ